MPLDFTARIAVMTATEIQICLRFQDNQVQVLILDVQRSCLNKVYESSFRYPHHAAIGDAVVIALPYCACDESDTATTLIIAGMSETDFWMRQIFA